MEAAGGPSGKEYGFSGPMFVLTHEPPDTPDPAVTFLTGDIGEAFATALDAAGERNLEILGADGGLLRDDKRRATTPNRDNPPGSE
jgi:hypothetical protein